MNRHVVVGTIENPKMVYAEDKRPFIIMEVETSDTLNDLYDYLNEEMLRGEE